VYIQDSHDCICWSDGEPIVVTGAQELVVVHANGRTLVMHRSKAADLKKVLDTLPADVRDLL
jgi:hypothetical protein